MVFKIFTYLNYLINIKSKYQIHAPFVFDFITKCLEKPTNFVLFNGYKQYKSLLQKDYNTIIVNDFGAGSKIFKSNIRKVKDIAHVAGMNNIKAKYLFKIISYFQPQSILEIGTSLGIGTYVFSIANPKSQIFTLEGCQNTSKIAQNYHTNFHLKNIEYKIGEFMQLIPILLEKKHFDLIYFDGNHTKTATLNYFYEALKFKKNDSIFIFDDIHWSKDMENAWNEIIDNKDVSVSIDLYHIGIIFFKKELSKQHFIL